ncbi:MAG: hypothetical protein KDD44_12975, partial [Bdellovibrionales bacterium]|nr:hypothetical protein [Bdellovibrionales bacterium]
MNAQPVPDTVLDPLQVGAASRDLEHIDPLFWTVTPEDAINLGYAWYVQHSEPAGSPMQDHAATSVAEREAFFEHFAHIPRARAYFTEIREAALTYARGLLNAHHHYSLQLEEARQRKHQRRRDNVLTATRTGFIRGGVKLLTTSMTALFASMAVLNKFLVEHSAPIGWTALAVAGGVLLMTIYFETGKIARQGR